MALFADAPLKYLVFDEAHTYAGATGAEVACLIRRVRSLAGKTADEILCIGTSATLSDPTSKGRTTTRRPAASPPASSASMPRREARRRVLRRAGSGPAGATSPSSTTATAWTA